MSDLARKLHQLKAADFKPEWKKINNTVVVTLNVHGRNCKWTFIKGSKVHA